MDWTWSLLGLLGLLGQDTAPDPAAQPPSFAEVVVVTASSERERIVDAVAMVTVVDRGALASPPNVVLDEQLRQVPGFSLLRRTSSFGAHPTTQGVSLRGVGTSGASRTLVLLDGLPLNDPFGGWVYWGQVPRAALESVEVVRGATSQLYGSAAMGGTIQLLTRDPKQTPPELSFRIGSASTWEGEGVAGGGGRWQYLVAARALDTAGYDALAESQRGAVDRPLQVASQGLMARLRRGDFRLGAHAYHETRGNGTVLQTNESRLGSLDLGFARGGWNASGYATTERFESRFSRILPGRDAEVLTAEQRFDYWSGGASVSRRLGPGWLFGADARRVSWSGKSQSLGGLYLQKTAAPTPRLELLGGARLDVWSADSTRTSFNPRVGALLRLTDDFSLRASAYRGFRVPTLNELYRPFRVGNIETQANPDLDEESLLGIEAGVDLHPSPRFLLRLNGFLSRLDDPIGNATLELLSGEILRRRENLGRVDVEGLEADLRIHLGSRWSLRAGYQLAASRIVESDLRVPQLPKHQGSFALTHRSGRLTAVAQARWSSSQFEDDLNQLPLGRSFVADVSLAIPLSRRLTAVLSAENVFDADVAVARVPLELYGTPRLLMAGLSLR